MSGTGITIGICWRGIDKRGIARSGQSVIDPGMLPAWVQHRYNQGWKWLKIEHHGRVIAEIVPPRDNSRRTWYAEGGQ